MSRVPSAKRANGFLLPLKTHKRKIPPPPQASPPLQESVVRRQRDQLFRESQHNFTSQRDQLFRERQHHLYFPAFGFVASVLRLSILTQKLYKI